MTSEAQAAPDNLSEDEKNLADFQRAVGELTREKKMFYRNNPTGTEDDLKQMLETRGKEILDKFSHLAQTIKGSSRAECYMLIGRVYNAAPGHSKVAEEYLNKAIKMNPILSDAWNELGECYYKGNDSEKALKCFNAVLKYVKCRIALRNLAKILRSAEIVNEENVQESIKYSKEALALDVTDGQSWFNLGNAYLTAFFFGGQPENILKQSLFCYEKALQDESQAEDPDLHFSVAEASKYTENFQIALDRYASADMFNPAWKVPLDKMDNIEMYLREIDEAVRTKGKMKVKKLEQLVRSIKPHHTSVFTTKRRTISDITWDRTDKDPEEEGHIVLKVVTTVSNRSLAFTCLGVDENLECVAVSIFNLSEGKSFSIGDTIVIAALDPRLHSVKLRDGTNICYRSLRVSDPRAIAVNGRLITSFSLAPIKLTTQLHNV